MAEVRDPRYARPTEAAAVLGVKPGSVHARLRRGTMPGRKFGGRWGVLRSWLEKQGRG